MNSLLGLSFAGIILAAIQFLVALPWVWAVDPAGFRRWSKELSVWGSILGGVLLAGFGIGYFMNQRGDVNELQQWGRIYGAILHFQLAADFIIGLSKLLVLVWPKGGAVANAALREATRQPMFWLIAILGMVVMVVSMFFPYFTFGEDYKMMKQLAFDLTMLAPALFALLAASIVTLPHALLVTLGMDAAQWRRSS